MYGADSSDGIEDALVSDARRPCGMGIGFSFGLLAAKTDSPGIVLAIGFAVVVAEVVAAAVVVMAEDGEALEENREAKPLIHDILRAVAADVGAL